MMISRHLTRKWRSAAGWTFAVLAMLLVLFGLFDMLATILWRGATSFQWSMLTTVTKGIAGGLQNAILGTLELTLISIIIAAPIGVLGGIYCSEFATPRQSAAIRFVAEVLSGVPSIVIGYFCYLLLVLRFGWSFSALAAGIALTIMMLPYILRNTESSLGTVPLTQREAAWALGMTRFQAIVKVVWKPAGGGIATGVLLAIAIAMGETAPLLYTAGWSSSNPSFQLTHQQVGYLTYVIWTYIDQPYPAAHALAYSAAFVLLVFILLIHLIVRSITRLTRVH